MGVRTATKKRKTSETDIDLVLNIDGTGKSDIATGVGFFDHMMTALAKHGKMDLTLHCKGDIEIDDHHTVEDCAIVLGMAIDEALGDKRGIARFGYAYAPLDEALARAVVDLSGRPFAAVDLNLSTPMVGQMGTRNLEHVLESLAMNAKATVHVDVLRGKDDHHKAEAAYKALALALRQAFTIVSDGDIPSTKGVL